MNNLTQTTPGGGIPEAGGFDLTGQTLGDFQILRKLGQGGMGQVYLAEQISLKRKVALKLLKQELAANETALRRFKLEAESVARATHANIVQVYFIGEDQGRHFMALEYVEGRNLRDFITMKGPPELLLGLSFMRQVAAALQRAGELGIIHRDIKPENILLTKKGEVKVADFGLSRVLESEQPAVNLTQSGVTMGTPLYMSPEQVEGKPLDHRTDMYSFGVSCWHMFAGEPPFRGSTAFEVAVKHVKEEPPPLQAVRPDLPPELCAVIHKMMAKSPAERYQNGRDLLRDLTRLREAVNGATGFVPLATSSVIEQPSVAATPSTKSLQYLGPRRLSAPVLLALFVGSLIVAGGAGAALGFFTHKDRGPGDDDEAKLDPTPTVETTTQKAREQKMLDAVKEYLDPANGYRPEGIGHCLGYALPLLKQPDRLADADDVFKRMAAVNAQPGYHLSGVLGQGIVFAIKDEWQLSAKQFSIVQKELQKGGKGKKPPEDRSGHPIFDVIRSNKDLQYWIRDAVHRNEVNSKGESNKDLPLFLRVVAGKSQPPRTGGDRPPNDKPVGRPMPMPMNQTLPKPE